MTNKSTSTVEEENLKDRDEDRDGGNGQRDIRLDKGEDDNTRNINKDDQHQLSSTDTCMFPWIRGSGFKFPPQHLLQYLCKKNKKKK